MISTINLSSVVLTKMIRLLESLASDFKNNIFKMTCDTLGKVQKKSSVATILNASNIYDASQISRFSSAFNCNIENDDTTITSSRTSTRRNKESTFSYRLVILWIQSQVLPLLIKNYGITLVQWKMNVDTTKVESILQEIVRDANKNIEEKLLVILATAFWTISLQSQVKYTFCPMMKRYRILLEDRRLHRSLLRYLINLNQKQKTGQQKNMMSYSRVSKEHFNLVKNPRAGSSGQIQRKGKYSKCVSNFLYSLCGGHHKNDPRRPLLEFLLYFALSETYQETWQDAIAINGGTPIPKIDKVTKNSIQSMCNINGNQMKILRSCLWTELGSSILAAQHKIYQILNHEYVEPMAKQFKFGGEQITWSYMATKYCLML